MNLLVRLILLCAFLTGSQAMAQTPLPKLKPPSQVIDDVKGAFNGSSVGQKLTSAAVTDIQNFLNAKFLPDLQYALKLANAANNKVTAPCYQAWIDIINTQQTAVKNADGTDLAMPDPHVITEFEKLVELRNALQPESDFMMKCSPVASMVKLDIAKFMGVVLAGGAGLATLVPGL